MATHSLAPPGSQGRPSLLQGTAHALDPPRAPLAVSRAPNRGADHRPSLNSCPDYPILDGTSPILCTTQSTQLPLRFYAPFIAAALVDIDREVCLQVQPCWVIILFDGRVSFCQGLATLAYTAERGFPRTTLLSVPLARPAR